MKTIKQIADEVGVSKQAVQKRISRDPLCTSIQPYISTVGSTRYIDDVGVNLIKKAFLQKRATTPDADIHMDKTTTVDTLVVMLQKELDLKNLQIADLTETIKTLSQSINANQHNSLAETLIAGQDQQLLTSSKKPGLFGRLFGKQ